MAEHGFLKRSWRQLVFDVPRFARHRESRRRVFSVLVALLIVAIVLGGFYGAILFFEYCAAGGWYGVGAVCVMYALAFTVRQSMKRRGNTLTLNLASGAKPSFRNALLQQSTIQRGLLVRAAFEAAFAMDPEKLTANGNTRSSVLRFLREAGTWGQMESPTHNLMIAQEGGWDLSTAKRALQLAEFIQLLEWGTHEDVRLYPLQNAHSHAREVVQSSAEAIRSSTPTADDEGTYVRSILEIEAQRQPAMMYLMRVRNELTKRGVFAGEFDGEIDDDIAQYMAYAESVGEADVVAEDLPIEGGLVREAASEDLESLMSLSAARFLAIEALQRAIRFGSVIPIQEQMLVILGLNGGAEAGSHP